MGPLAPVPVGEMSLLGKNRKKLVEYSQTPDKGAWLYDLWKWRYFNAAS